MAAEDEAITGLSSHTTSSANDLYVVVDVASGVTKKQTRDQLLASAAFDDSTLVKLDGSRVQDLIKIANAAFIINADGTVSIQVGTGSGGNVIKLTGSLQLPAGSSANGYKSIAFGGEGTGVYRDTGYDGLKWIINAVNSLWLYAGGAEVKGNLSVDGTLTVAGQAVATEAFVDARLVGLRWKSPVVVATTDNITLSGEQTIDDILTSTSRVLVKNQLIESENGIYVSAAGSWTRSTDTDSATELEGAAVLVQQGTVNADRVYTQTTDVITLGSSNIIWTQFGAGITILPATEQEVLDHTSNTVYASPSNLKKHTMITKLNLYTNFS